MLENYEHLLKLVQDGDIPNDIALKYLLVLLHHDFHDEGVAELIDTACEIYEFWQIRKNYKPEPKSGTVQKDITLRFDE